MSLRPEEGRGTRVRRRRRSELRGRLGRLRELEQEIEQVDGVDSREPAAGRVEQALALGRERAQLGRGLADELPDALDLDEHVAGVLDRDGRHGLLDRVAELGRVDPVAGGAVRIADREDHGAVEHELVAVLAVPQPEGQGQPRARRAGGLAGLADERQVDEVGQPLVEVALQGLHAIEQLALRIVRRAARIASRRGMEGDHRCGPAGAGLVGGGTGRGNDTIVHGNLSVRHGWSQFTSQAIPSKTEETHGDGT